MTDRDRLIELLLQSDPIKERDLDDDWYDGELEDIADYLLANGVIVPPVKFGGEVFVSPNRGENFHKAKLYGCDEKGTWLVWVNDNLLTEEDKHIVANPMKKTFYDWFIKIYTKEEAEQALAERNK